MKEQKEKNYCPICIAQTEHVVILIRKESPYQGQKNQKLKEFFAGVLKGWALGPLMASLDDFDRHKICEECGHKTIDNE